MAQLPPSIPNPETGYKFAEQSIKTLLNSYLRLFVPGNLVKISRELGCTIYRIPDIYIKHANLSDSFSKLPKSFAKKDSVYFVPESSTPLEFKRIPLQTVLKLQKFREDIIKGFDEDVSKAAIEDETDIEFQKWSIFLQIYDTSKMGDQIPTLESLNSFENDKTKVKLMIIGGYQAARGVFYYYKNKYTGDFDTIDIVFDEENFCLSLVDTRFPNWKFQKKISFRLEKSV